MPQQRPHPAPPDTTTPAAPVFSSHFRGRPRRARGRPPARFAAVSLFSGCGGFDFGAEKTGDVEVVWAVDNDEWAVRTYEKKLGRHVWHADVTETAFPDVPCDILLAGPPCQDFSTLWNLDGARTERGNLFREVARFLDQRRPKAFIIENVPLMLTANRGEAWILVRHALRSPSQFLYNAPGDRYEISAALVDFADLGVPQRRRRLIITGIRKDLGVLPGPIPRPFAGHHKTAGDALDRKPISPEAANHETCLDTDRVVERMKLIPAGGNYTSIPDGHPLAVRGLISHVYRRLDPDAPSYTIIANGGGGTHGYHHREPRRLSNREKARLQSFPDDFEFDGGQTGAYQNVRRQIGNAVPPDAAEIIVKTLVDTLRAAHIDGTVGHTIRKAKSQVAAERPHVGEQTSALHRVSQ